MNRKQRRTVERNVKTKINISDLRKKNNGEVFTPPTLVDEMLDTLPVITWAKKDITVLDPCMGATCVFPIMMLFRFSNGLRNEIPNPAMRVRHILENNLYMCELDPHSCDYGTAMLSHYGRILSFFLMIDDSEATVGLIKQKYIDAYQGIIDNFYQELGAKTKMVG